MRANSDRQPRSHRTRLRSGACAAFLALVVLLAGVAPAVADTYERDHAGHPLRIIAYVLHPFGVLIGFIVLRPAHWLGSQNGMRTVFGHDPPK